MNLNQITPGTDYAFFPQRGRGEEFRWLRGDNEKWIDRDSYSYSQKYFVYRVKAIRAYSERQIGKSRDTGYVDVFWLTDEGEFRYDDNGQEVMKTILVRDIATLWDDYEDELDYRKVEKERKERERAEQRRKQEEEWEREREERAERRRLEQERLERERLERERIAREEQERLERERQLFIERVETFYKLPAGSIQFDANGSPENLLLNRESIEIDMNKDKVHLLKWSSSGP